MPKEEFSKVFFDANGNIDFRLNHLADHFDVSFEAASNRAKWLNLIKW